MGWDGTPGRLPHPRPCAAGLEAAFSSREITTTPDLLVPEPRNAAGDAGLLFIHGHEDATPLERSRDGEAANMEIAVLVGMTGERLPPPMNDAFGALEFDALAMLGPRDDLWRGLTWPELTETLRAALRAGGCRGWSLVIYNPDLDPGGSQARRIVQFVSEVVPHLP